MRGGIILAFSNRIVATERNPFPEVLQISALTRIKKKAHDPPGSNMDDENEDSP
jgi:hypothetical protein